MSVGRLTSKGQLTIPKKIRERLGLDEGDEVEFKEKREGVLLKKKPKRSPFDRYVGYLKRKKGLRSDEIIEALRGR
jgi:AbrB family looped-hinge helix DNA binding protein